MRISSANSKCYVDRKLVASAYDSWLSGQRLAWTKPSTNPAQEFARVVAAQFPGLLDPSTKLGLPGSKQGWSDWRKKTFARKALLKKEVCEAILTLTGFDVTESQEFLEFCSNVTDVAIVDRFVAKRLSNAPTDGDEEYELTITRLDFKQSATIEVTADWMNSPAKDHDHLRVVGTLKWGIREAAIDISCSGTLETKLEIIEGGQSTEFGQLSSAINCVIDDAQVDGRWLVQSIPGQVLGGVCKNLVVSRSRCAASSEVFLTVSARTVDVVPDFLPMGSGALKRDGVQLAKEKLISKMLSIKLAEGPHDDFRVLSRARVVTP